MAAAFEFTPIGRSIADPRLAWVAFACYLVASITDWFDGYLARKWKQTTALGALLDPLADKILVAACLIGLTAWRVVPAWTVTLVLGREFLVTGLRVMIAETGGGVLPASWPGKVKAALQMVAIALYLCPGSGLKWLADIVYYLAVFLTTYSGAEYVWKARGVWSRT